jgi:hypothetical protein
MAPKDAREVADKRMISVYLTITEWARRAKNVTLGGENCRRKDAAEFSGKATVEGKKELTNWTHPYLKELRVDNVQPAARQTKPLLHHVETMSTFIQWQSWQIIPGSITHPGKECGYFTTLRLEATTQ